MVLEDSRGPIPLEREMGEATVGISVVGNSVVVTVVVTVNPRLLGRLSIGSGHDKGRVDMDSRPADDRALRGGKVPVNVDATDAGTVSPGVPPPRMDTTTGDSMAGGTAGVAGVAVSIDSGGMAEGIRKETEVEGKDRGKEAEHSQAVKTVWVR